MTRKHIAGHAFVSILAMATILIFAYVPSVVIELMGVSQKAADTVAACAAIAVYTPFMAWAMMSGRFRDYGN